MDGELPYPWRSTMAARLRAASRKSKTKGNPNAPSRVQPPAAGWAALADGRWEAARTAFANALKDEESPETLEGLSWAAWWLDDADTVFDARERAYRLYRRRGDAACAARMATWLAADHLDFHGALAVANGWLQRARRLLQTIPPGPDHGWLAFHEGYVALVQGDVARSSELARSASELGERFEVPDVEMLGLALEGAALVASAKVQEGMRRLDEATTVALESEASIPISRAWACCFLVTACEAVRDFRRAFEWCDRIAEFAERFGSRYMLGFCRQHYAAIHMWRGQWQEAEAQFEAAIDAYARSRPAFAGGVRAGLAELRRRQGRWSDAEQLLDRATSQAVLVCRSKLARSRGDPQRALALAERALRQTPAHIVIQRAPALEALIAAAVDCDDWPRAHAALAELKRVADAVDTAPLRAAVNLAQGILAAATGNQEQARRQLEDAVDGFERSGAPFETAEARLALSKSLTALGRTAEAAEEARLALERLRELGVNAEAREVWGRMGPAPHASRQTPAIPEISPREREVLRCVAEGLTNRQIAARLFVSEHTIHRHITSILRKLDLPTRTAAAAHALRAGLLGPSAT
jgi:DNA-binding NarL/FixJ family response regulator